MLVLGIIATLALIAFLVAFRGDFKKQSLTIGVRPPTELRDYPADLLQHIRETNYVWRQVMDGAMVGTLERGFGRHFAISWEREAGVLTLTDECDFRIGAVGIYRNSRMELIALANFRTDFRAELDLEVMNQVRRQQSGNSAALPRAQTR